MHTKPPSSDPVIVLKKALTCQVLEDIRNFWFEHIIDNAQITVPSRDLATKWFSQNDDYDKTCRAKFGSTLDLIRSVNPTTSRLVEAVKLESPLNWMSMILLLDQIPRNCYRQDEARIAYQFFDPLALNFALQAIDAGVPDTPEIRFRHGY
ncbi:hypothetical protein CEP54_006437 [Fusarium duplospermum]|uniref:Uncharacterized protein n=1 Tax=Fusarium duplospermum TaxID=1325734 RepID=A0A428Q6S7_9HYPO|nr:hypothetical protein CEP54_006437 [Fusarium duplospermum]